mgnify:CR=1 FL=1
MPSTFKGKSVSKRLEDPQFEHFIIFTPLSIISNELYNTLNPQNKEKLYIVENPSEYSLWSSTITYKKGDKVKVITGAYKGTIGEVKAVFPKEDRVIVEGVNMVKKHLKPTQANPDGGIVEKEAKIHVSNVMLYDEKAKVASRITTKVEVVDGKNVKTRVFKKSGNEVK